MGIPVTDRRGGATLAHRLGVDPHMIQMICDWSSEAYWDCFDPTTPEDRVYLPVAMTRWRAHLGLSGVFRQRPMSRCGLADREVGVSSWFAVHASASKA